MRHQLGRQVDPTTFLIGNWIGKQVFRKCLIHVQLVRQAWTRHPSIQVQGGVRRSITMIVLYVLLTYITSHQIAVSQDGDKATNKTLQKPSMRSKTVGYYKSAPLVA